MEQIIYVDILIGVNILVNYFLLLTTAKLRKIAPKKLRLLISSAVGAGFSLIIFLPPVNIILLSIIKIIFSAVLTLIAFGYKNGLYFVKNLVLFYASNFIFAGAMLAIWFFISPKGMVINNSVVYFNISAVMLVITTAVIYLFVMLISNIIERTFPKDSIYKLKLRLNEKETELITYLDTGNHLRDVFTGYPVIIGSAEKIAQLFENDIKSIIISDMCASQKYENIKQKAPDILFKLIPFCTVGGDGMMLSFAPDEAIISSVDCVHKTDKILVAISDKGFFKNEYDGLINPYAVMK